MIKQANWQIPWNSELRDSVVLPLIPSVLRDTLDSKMVTSAELAGLISGLAGSEWFALNRKAVCKESALVRMLDSPSKIVWRLLSNQDALRPLPQSLLNPPRRIEEIFPGIFEWARAREVHLCVDMEASLTSERKRWAPQELESLFSMLTPKAFQAGALASLLKEFLGSVASESDQSESIGCGLAKALRDALVEPPGLAPEDRISTLVRHIPDKLIFPLPISVAHRALFRAFAMAPSDVLPVRGTWVADTYRHRSLSDSDLHALLLAAESMLESNFADQADTAALYFLARSERTVEELAARSEYARIAVLRARDVRAGEIISLSLEKLFRLSKMGLLFAPSPNANALLPSTVAVLPTIAILIVEGKTAELLNESNRSNLRLRSVAGEAAAKEVVFSLVNDASAFGEDRARLDLLERIRPGVGDDRRALRRLCTGERGAGDSNAEIWALAGLPKSIERIVTFVLKNSDSDFLVPLRIADELTLKVRNHLLMKTLDTSGLEMLLE